LPETFFTTDIRGQFIFLGTGTSVGVPVIGCGCKVCRDRRPLNNRTRCAVALGLPGGNLLIDTPPDLRVQLLREEIGVIHSVLFTHEHADHIFGLDDLRLFPFALGHAVPVFCEPKVEARLRKAYDYAFADREETHAGSKPKLEIHTIGLEPFETLGQRVVPVRLGHGPHFDVLGFRIGDVAYCTDAKTIPEESWPKLAGLDTLVIGALRPRSHPTHMNIEEALAAAERIGARRTYLTHLSHDIDYDRDAGKLPANVFFAYDGLRIPLSL